MARLATVYSRATLGIVAPLVKVQVHIAGGLPGMTIVGLAETAVREARDRVRAALQSSGFTVPPSRITINLAPADLPKHGSRYDLAIALGILLASEAIPALSEDIECAAELGLDGSIRGVSGLLPMARACASEDRRLIIGSESLREVQWVKSLRTGVGSSLLGVCAALQGETPWPEVPALPCIRQETTDDLRQIRGQNAAKRSLEIAAAGGHNLLFFGPPGSGKTMLARSLPGLLPPMGEEAAMELACIQSLGASGFQTEKFAQRPFRQPHSSTTVPALVGGGSSPIMPGEISLATSGVLCLDELPEFSRSVLEALREPLESGRVRLSRARQQLEYPAKFQLVATMNPCPCGFLGDATRDCRCTAEQVQRYRARVSGPLLDRIDMHLRVARPNPEDLLTDASVECTTSVAQRVQRARQRMWDRQGSVNAKVEAQCFLDPANLSSNNRQFLHLAMDRLCLSARGINRTLRVARTIADLASSDAIEQQHLAEALALRQLDRLK